MDITIPYYEDNTRVSNSNIGQFLNKGPRYLRDLLDGKEEGLKGPCLDKGTMIHEYILQPNDFWGDYVINDYETPKVKQQKDFCIAYANSLELIENDKLISAYRSAYSNTKPDENVVLEATKLVEKYKDYIKALKDQADNRKIISFADLNMLKNIESNLKEHKKANKILFDFPSTFEAHNEFHINWEFPNASEYGDLPCKSLLDRVMIDHVNKKIVLVDLKTTADVYNFAHSVDTFDYKRQLAYYWMAIHWYFLNELKLEIADYDYETYIIAIQSNGSNEVKVFKFKPESLEERIPTICDAVRRIAWHINTNNWDHVKEYYEGDGTEELKDDTK